MRASQRLSVWFLLALAGCSGTEPPPAPRVANKITIASGNNQTAAAGTSLTAPVTFVVADAEGPMAGVSVTFAVTDPNASVTPSTQTSDAAGVVSALWTVGGALGQQTLTATIANVTPAAAKATVQAGPPALLTPLSEANQYLVVGSLVPSVPSVKVTDIFGNPIANQEVTFLDATDRSTLAGAVTTSNGAGIASLTAWRIGRAAGTYTVQARAGSSASAAFVAVGTPGLFQAAGGNNQSANAGTAIPVAPSVRAFDDLAQPLAGVSVVFSVTGGSGRLLASAPLETGIDGTVAAPSWILGLAPGSNELSATTPGLPAIKFAATGVVAVPTAIDQTAGAVQIGFAGNFASVAPSVRLSDGTGAPVAGIPVTFTVTAGGGTLSGAATTTDFDGRASLGAWRYGTGAQTVTATAAGVAPAPFSASTTAVPPSGYDITVRFLGSATTSQQAAFTDAAARWSTHILGDLADVDFTPADEMDFCGNQPLDERVDDLLIFARIGPIDGVGGVLGQAYSCWLRDDDFLSIVGLMEFDVADVTGLESSGRFKDVVLHEMGHVIGFSSGLWELKELISGPGTSEPTFTGPSTRMAFAASLSGTGPFVGKVVPLESTGGAGTRDSHWRETLFTNELMTGFLNTVNPISAMTISAFRDQGYVVTDANADPFTFAAALRAASQQPGIVLHTGNPAVQVRTKGRSGPVRRIFDLRAGPFKR